MSEPSRVVAGVKTAAGFSIVVLGLLLVAPVPLLVGVIVASQVPVVGTLRHGLNAWSLFHLAWVLLVWAVAEIIGAGLRKAIEAQGRKPPGGALPVVFAFVGLCLALNVYFAHPAGSVVASAVATGVHLAAKSATDKFEASRARAAASTSTE